MLLLLVVGAGMMLALWLEAAELRTEWLARLCVCCLLHTACFLRAPVSLPKLFVFRQQSCVVHYCVGSASGRCILLYVCERCTSCAASCV